MKPIVIGKNLKLFASIFFILLITYASFYSCLENDFTNWDDARYLTDNIAVRSLSLRNLINISTSFIYGNYHPLTILSYAIEYHFFQYRPFIYHLTNLILHLLNCLFVFWLLYLISRKISLALITAVLFAVHPLHVEPVAWISARKDLLYSFFFLGALISYIYYLHKKSDPCYYLAITLFILSLLSKATAISLALTLFLIDYISYRKPDKIMILDKIPFFVLSFCFGITAVFGLDTIGLFRTETAVNLWHKLLTAGYAICVYLYKVFVPLKLACIYPHPGVKASFVYSLLAVSLLIAAVVLSKKHTRKVIFGSAFFLFTVFPVLQFVPVTAAIVADRYTYIPLIGVFYIIGAAVSRVYEKRLKSRILKSALLVISAIALIALSFLTWERCKVWKNSITLWKDAIKKIPDATTAYYSLGCEYQLLGKNKEAIESYLQAIKINPGYIAAYNNLAVIYVDAGQTGKAIEVWNRVTQIDPSLTLAHAILAKLYFKQGQYDSAIEHCDRVFSLGAQMDPEFVQQLKPYRK